MLQLANFNKSRKANMEINLVVEGLKFMVLGMVTVFLFLILMVYVLKIQTKIILKYFPQKQASLQAKSPEQNQNLQNNTLVAVITAAITQFKQDKGM